jgi:hypothetical protein
MRTYAPRILNEPARCRFSHLIETGPPTCCDRLRMPSSGVVRATPTSSSRAARTSASPTTGTAAGVSGTLISLTPVTLPLVTLPGPLPLAPLLLAPLPLKRLAP